MLTRFLPRSRTAIVTTCLAGGLVLAGGGIATGAALAGSAAPAAAPMASTATHSKGAQPKAAGEETVTAVTSSSVTVDTKRAEKTFALTGATTYRQGTAQVPASSLQAGDKVRIRIVPGTASHPVAQTVTIVPPPSSPASPSSPSPASATA